MLYGGRGFVESPERFTGNRPSGMFGGELTNVREYVILITGLVNINPRGLGGPGTAGQALGQDQRTYESGIVAYRGAKHAFIAGGGAEPEAPARRRLSYSSSGSGSRQ